MLSIGELAARTGASVRSLRHYEQNGLLVSVRQPNGYRQFDPSALQFVDRIRTLLRNGFTLDEIRPIVSMLDARTAVPGICPDVIAQYGRKLDELDQRIAALAEIRARAAERLAALQEQRRDPPASW
jgi:MerR family copper efflux transcriptional regulator